MAKAVKKTKEKLGKEIKLSANQIKSILFEFHDLAPDTWDESEITNWKFTDIKYNSKADEYELFFTNSIGDSSIVFKSKHQPFDDVGNVTDKWFTDGSKEVDKWLMDVSEDY